MAPRPRKLPRVAHRWQAGTLPDDLYLDPLPSRRSAVSVPTAPRWRVVDDWSERVPVTPEEVEVFEHWFGKMFDELLAKERKR